jgi:hypothetical protein
MSHVAVVKMNRIRSLDSLKAACARIGLVFQEGQQTYKWFGKWMNDYDGENAAYRAAKMDPKLYGKCDHAISVKGKKDAYEIGVVKAKDGDGYELVWDDWNGGYGLIAAAGTNCAKLADAYGLEEARAELYEMGAVEIKEEVVEGQVELVAYL